MPTKLKTPTLPYYLVMRLMTQLRKLDTRNSYMHILILRKDEIKNEAEQ